MNSTKYKPHNLSSFQTVSVEKVLRLLSLYPFKKEIWRSQNIQPKDVSSFHGKIIERKLEKEGLREFWGVGDCLKGLFFLEEALWPSKMLQKKVFRVDYPLKSPDADSQDWKFILSRIPSLAKENQGQLLSIKVDAEDFETFNLLSNSGWIWLGLSLFLTKTTKGIDSSQIQKYTHQNNSGLIIRDFDPQDQHSILEISNTSHERNHYFNDPLISPEIKKDIFPLWVEKCLTGLAAKTLVAEVENKVAGFITLMENKSFSEAVGQKIGIIDFVAVNKNLQGKGIGKILTLAAMDWLGQKNDHIILRTMHDNYGAIRFYQRLGFQIAGGDHFFHLHLSE